MGLPGHKPPTAEAEGRTFVLRDLLLAEERGTSERPSARLIREEEMHILLKSKVSLVLDIIRQPTEF